MKPRPCHALFAVFIAAALLAPFGAGGIAVPVHAEFPSSETARPPIRLTITADQRVLLNGRAVRLQRLEGVLRAAVLPGRTVIISADHKIPYSFLLRVLEAIRPLAHSNLIATEASDPQ